MLCCTTTVTVLEIYTSSTDATLAPYGYFACLKGYLLRQSYDWCDRLMIVVVEAYRVNVLAYRWDMEVIQLLLVCADF